MAKTNKSNQAPDGYLMEIGPEGMERIRPYVNECLKQQIIRSKAWDKIVDAKENIRVLVEQEELSPAPNGKIVFKIDGSEVSYTPRDASVKVSEVKEE